MPDLTSAADQALPVPEDRAPNLPLTHEMVMLWLLQNPDRTKKECADHFGRSAQWVYMLTNSDAFRAKLAERQEALFGVVAAGIPDALKAAAHIGLDKVTAHLIASEDKEFVLKATDKLLAHMGYGGKASVPPSSVTNITNNTLQVSAADLEAARANARQIALARQGQEVPQLLASAEVLSA